MKKNNKKGFTLAELLIVVAIIAVLTAIAIPVFTTQLERSREATDMSNMRAAYAEVMSEYLTNGNKATSATVSCKQMSDSWQNPENGYLFVRVNGSESSVRIGDDLVGSGKTVVIGITDSASVSVGAAGGTTGG